MKTLKVLGMFAAMNLGILGAQAQIEQPQVPSALHQSMQDLIQMVSDTTITHGIKSVDYYTEPKDLGNGTTIFYKHPFQVFEMPHVNYRIADNKNTWDSVQFKGKFIVFDYDFSNDFSNGDVTITDGIWSKVYPNMIADDNSVHAYIMANNEVYFHKALTRKED